MTWSQFLKAYWALRGLVTFYILFVIELETRKIEIAGVTPGPNCTAPPGWPGF